MKKVLRFSLVLLMMFCIVSLGFQNISNATKYSSEMQALITANYTDSTNSTGKINNLVGTIISAIRIVGVAVAVVVLTPLSLVIANFIAKRTFSMFKKQSETRGEQTAYIDEMISGAKVVKAHPNIVKYLGLTLLPQAGVAIGMAQVVSISLGGETAEIVTAVVLCATLIYELFGPVITKIALKKAGEIQAN